MKAHLKLVAANEKPAEYICDICIRNNQLNVQYSFSNKSYLLGHMQRCHIPAPKRLTCPHCKITFKYNSTLSWHINRYHVDPKDWKYTCTICSKKLCHAKALHNHMLYHSGIKYPCETCGALFAAPHIVQTHIRNVHNKSQHTCPVCTKSFGTEKYLSQHLKTHNQGDYTCPICPATHFSLTTTLRSHLKSKHPSTPLPEAGTILKNFDWKKFFAQHQATE